MILFVGSVSTAKVGSRASRRPVLEVEHERPRRSECHRSDASGGEASSAKHASHALLVGRGALGQRCHHYRVHRLAIEPTHEGEERL